MLHMKQKIKTFLQEDLSNRVSTWLVIFAGLFPVWLCFQAIIELYVNHSDPMPTVGLVFAFYIFFILSITSAIALASFLTENKIKSFRLKNKILNSKAFKKIILFLYILSIICSYFVPALFLSLIILT